MTTFGPVWSNRNSLADLRRNSIRRKQGMLEIEQHQGTLATHFEANRVIVDGGKWYEKNFPFVAEEQGTVSFSKTERRLVAIGRKIFFRASCSKSFQSSGFHLKLVWFNSRCNDSTAETCSTSTTFVYWIRFKKNLLWNIFFNHSPMTT